MQTEWEWLSRSRTHSQTVGAIGSNNEGTQQHICNKCWQNCQAIKSMGQPKHTRGNQQCPGLSSALPTSGWVVQCREYYDGHLHRSPARKRSAAHLIA